MIKENKFNDLKKDIVYMKKTAKEIISLSQEISKVNENVEKKMILNQLDLLKKSFKATNQKFEDNLEKISLVNPLKSEMKKIPSLPIIEKNHIFLENKIEPRKIDSKIKSEGLNNLEKHVIKRLKIKTEKVDKKKEIKPSKYVGLANRFFSKTSKKLLNKGLFKNLKRNLVKGNMRFLPKSYISVILFNTLLSLFASIFIFIFFLFFNFGAQIPFLTQFKGNLLERISYTFWIMVILPFATFLFTYLYPLMERKTIESNINHELPFATIHMASISESLVEPSNIFKIIISTKEYPIIEKEFIKLLNEINIFGADLVTALRNSAFNSPSRKLSELLDGLATTITSGGNLSEFFEKRSQTLLFEHKLDKEKQTKSAETFMDIYISVVIAAPMIFMLLLIMMRVSGLGIALSTNMISLVMVLGVSVLNVVFLTFLQLKKQA